MPGIRNRKYKGTEARLLCLKNSHAAGTLAGERTGFDRLVPVGLQDAAECRGKEQLSSAARRGRQAFLTPKHTKPTTIKSPNNWNRRPRLPRSISEAPCEYDFIFDALSIRSVSLSSHVQSVPPSTSTENWFLDLPKSWDTQVPNNEQWLGTWLGQERTSLANEKLPCPSPLPYKVGGPHVLSRSGEGRA